MTHCEAQLKLAANEILLDAHGDAAVLSSDNAAAPVAQSTGRGASK
jgi:hypothetical protein